MINVDNMKIIYSVNKYIYIHISIFSTHSYSYQYSVIITMVIISNCEINIDILIIVTNVDNMGDYLQHISCFSIYGKCLNKCW